MVLSEAIRDFAEYARHELGHAQTTSYTYHSWQGNFARWLDEQGHGDPDIRQIDAGLVRRYSYSLANRDLRPRSVRSALHSLRALFTFLVNDGALTENPATEVGLPKKDAAKRLLVNDEDLQKLLDAAERQRSDFRCKRDRAVLAVLVFCGLRRQELLDLRVPDISLPDRSLLVQCGKGSKARTVYLCDEALAARREWLALRQSISASHDTLFTVEDKRRFGETTLAHMLEEIAAIAGMKGDPRIKPHSIRHAAATRLMRNGADLKSIQAWLGHSHLQTTAVYLHTDEQQARRIGPLAGMRPTEDQKADQEGTSRTPYAWRRRGGR